MMTKDAASENTIRFEMPKYVGCYTIDESFSVALTKRPNWIHRFFMKLCLGWAWNDYNDKV